jgi:predicted choloylglycine hydrolase
METTTHMYSFNHLAGSSYEVGRQQGLALRQIPPFAQFMTSVSPEWDKAFGAETRTLIRVFCPGLEEEIHGLADALEVDPVRIAYAMTSYLLPPRCSHLAVLPDRSINGHTLVARSYEFGPESNDNRLCLTRVEGKYAHIGASSIMLGRLDGINERGLSVTMSAGGIPVSNRSGFTPPPCKGLSFWMAVRAALENCADVAEAVDFLRSFPHGGNPIILLADRSGRAARVEIYGRTVHVDQIENGAICAANHFQSEEMAGYSRPVMRNSLNRLALMRTLVDRSEGAVGVDDLRGLLTSEYPRGLCAHFYREWFGTLHSLVFDLNALEAWICLGSPAVNEWRRFTFSYDQQSAVYPVRLPQADGFEAFWGPAE